MKNGGYKIGSQLYLRHPDLYCTVYGGAGKGGKAITLAQVLVSIGLVQYRYGGECGRYYPSSLPHRPSTTIAHE